MRSHRSPKASMAFCLSLGVFLLFLTACRLDLSSTDVQATSNHNTSGNHSTSDELLPLIPSSVEADSFPAQFSATIPQTIHTIPIVDANEHGLDDGASGAAYITDAVYDPVTNQIYTSDTLGKVSIVDAGSYAVVHSFEAWGYLQLDAGARRLYITPDEFPLPLEAESLITILELGGGVGEVPTLFGTVEGMAIAVDTDNQRLFIGEPLAPGDEPTTVAGIRIYDSSTLEQIGESNQGGRPVYNPFRDELLIVAYTVYVADAQTGAVLSELPILPEGEEPFLWCNGCTWATYAYILEDDQQVGILSHPHASRRYVSYPLRAFDAVTLEPLAEPILHEDRGPDCGNPLRLHLPPQIANTKIHHAFDANYLVENFLEFYRQDEINPIERMAGIAPAFIDGNSAQLTTVDGLLINLQTLMPITLMPITTTDPLCIFGELASGELYGRRLPPWSNGGELRIVDSAEALIKRPKPIMSAGLLGYEVAEILAPITETSPPKTLFVRTEFEDGLFRTEDGGDTWSLLEIGLPWDLFSGMSVQLSPDFVNDQTLFVAGPNAHHRGLGVWISVDGGDTWHPRWNGLDDLRVASLFVSPLFSMDEGADQSAATHAESNQALVLQSVSGKIYRSLDAGASWTLVESNEENYSFENLARFVEPQAPTEATVDKEVDKEILRVRIDLITGDLVYRTGEGDDEEWRTAPIELSPLSNGSPQHWMLTIAAPDDPFTVYALSERTIWRTLDGGINWLPVLMPGLETLPDNAYLRTATLVGDTYGPGTTLLVGTSHGEVWGLE